MNFVTVVFNISEKRTSGIATVSKHSLLTKPKRRAEKRAYVYICFYKRTPQTKQNRKKKNENENPRGYWEVNVNFGSKPGSRGALTSHQSTCLFWLFYCFFFMVCFKYYVLASRTNADCCRKHLLTALMDAASSIYYLLSMYAIRLASTVQYFT